MAADAIIQRALVKEPGGRYRGASDMAREIREAITLLESGEAAKVQIMTRLIVLPFRIARPDPEIDFLASSLPEAITESLSGMETLTVRSPAAAARFAGEDPDLKALAAEARVDLVLLGTLLRAGDQVRVSSKRGKLEVRAVVTKRLGPLQVDGKKIYQIGIPIHWGFVGINTGQHWLANALTPFVGDASARTPEFKAFLVNIEKM